MHEGEAHADCVHECIGNHVEKVRIHAQARSNEKRHVRSDYVCISLHASRENIVCVCERELGLQIYIYVLHTHLCTTCEQWFPCADCASRENMSVCVRELGFQIYVHHCMTYWFVPQEMARIANCTHHERTLCVCVCERAWLSNTCVSLYDILSWISRTLHQKHTWPQAHLKKFHLVRHDTLPHFILIEQHVIRALLSWENCRLLHCNSHASFNRCERGHVCTATRMHNSEAVNVIVCAHVHVIVQ